MSKTRLTKAMRAAAVREMREALAEPLVEKAAAQLSAVIVTLLRRQIPEALFEVARDYSDYILFADKIHLGYGYRADISGFPVSQKTRNCYDYDDLVEAHPDLTKQLDPFYVALAQAAAARDKLVKDAHLLFLHYRYLETLFADWPECEKWFHIQAKVSEEFPVVRCDGVQIVRCDGVQKMVEAFKRGVLPEEKQ